MDLQELKNKILDLEKGYKQLCIAHDNNKIMHLSAVESIDAVNKTQQEIMKLMKAQKEINLDIVQRLLALEIQ
tara:strand:- start:293 stop:511 length:219 start_codon:yes stop_codon:yes gene_type:complete